MKITPKPAKKIPGKKRKWHFRPSGVKQSTVLRELNCFGKEWRFSSKSLISISPRLHSRNFSKIQLIPPEDDTSTLCELGALDLFVFHRLISQNKKLKDQLGKVYRICSLKDPLVRITGKDIPSEYYHLCLECDYRSTGSWRWYIRSREFILNNKLDNPYHVAGIPR